ncbi:Ltp family lipoprotein [Nocardioides sp. Soil805]|uniref:Ltp family lipoprotein n=1 Tax=Nocardioides sp. Soil805 TaxID=1736416 RepID=UPI0009EADB01|nr:Ltp family lipoprotein [Nocardioides sp. Soil805]
MKSIVKIGLGIVFGFILLVGGCAAVVGVAMSDSDTDTDKTFAEKATEKRDKVTSEEGADATAATAKTKPTKAPKPEPVLTPGQENAMASAENYINMTAFSHKGLVEQLVFEDYSEADAIYAVNHIKVDWNEQAAKSAKNYLDMTAFSRQGLIDQLVFEGYTPEQATYGVNQTGL